MYQNGRCGRCRQAPAEALREMTGAAVFYAVRGGNQKGDGRCEPKQRAVCRDDHVLPGAGRAT